MVEGEGLIPSRNLGSEYAIKLWNVILIYRSIFPDLSYCGDCLLSSRHITTSLTGSTEVGVHLQVREGSIPSIPTPSEHDINRIECKPTYGLNFFDIKTGNCPPNTF